MSGMKRKDIPLKSIVIIMGVFVSVFFAGGKKALAQAETPQSPTSRPMALKEVPLPLINGGFEDDLAGWKVTGGTAQGLSSSERAASGKHSLKLYLDRPSNRLCIVSGRVPVRGQAVFELRCAIYYVSGWGVTVCVRELDANGKAIGSSDDNRMQLWSRKQGKWHPFVMPFITRSNAAMLEVWIEDSAHNGQSAFKAYLDDFELVEMKGKPIGPPWQGQYKIKPHEKHRLTPADVVGPDGVVYPNWTKVGVQGGIPDVKVAARIEDFGGKADDDEDDSNALESACASVGENGGGAVLLGEGTYYLSRSVAIRHDNVVIRGQRADKTRLVFRLPAGGMGLYTGSLGGLVTSRTALDMVCDSKGLKTLTMLADDVVVGKWSVETDHTFVTVNTPNLFAALPDGPHTLKSIAEYADGSKRTSQIAVILNSSGEKAEQAFPQRAVISFQGEALRGPELKLAQDGNRGDMKLHLVGVEGLKGGDSIVIVAPQTERWDRLVMNACKWGYYRRYALLVEKIEGNTIAVTQPLRIDFPVVDGSYVQKASPIQRCGIEHLTIEQVGEIQERLKMTSVYFYSAWNCWARGVRIKRPGSHAIFGTLAKWCEIRDCVFDNPWNKGGGGSAYTGWEYSWDCLIENVETFRMRHAPGLQWAASGNVVRKSVFHESDGQWHAGWCNENLFEQCVIESTTQRNGGYGYGLFATPPGDILHGPIGPRNVVYNCDIFAMKGGLWMGGMNENWLILYNRFVTDAGQGIFAKTASFDHIIKGNVFVLKNIACPMVYLASPDCIGWEIIDNRLYGGNGRFVGGPCKPGVLEGNNAFPLGQELPERPKPAVPSIYEWQNRRK